MGSGGSSRLAGKLGPAAILNQNLIFEMTSSIDDLSMERADDTLDISPKGGNFNDCNWADDAYAISSQWMGW
jgi:hypothetical protein